MAIVGNAKNARVEFRAVQGYAATWYLQVRGSRYTIDWNDGGNAVMVERGGTRLATTTVATSTPLTDVWKVEFVDAALKVFKNNVQVVSLTDSAYLVAGAWDLVAGTLVSFENLDAPANITVTDVTVAPTSATLTVGNTQQLTATVAPADATNKAVSWSSSNNAVATVNSAGLVTAVAAGTATITVTTADGGKTATCAVAVVPTPKIYIGTQAVNKVYLGSTPVDRIYLGTTEVYNKNI